MSEEDRENLGGALGIGVGAICALWFVSWLFHLGPNMRTEEGPWWGIAYYLTSVAAAVVAWAGVATAIFFAVQRLPLSANSNQEK